VVLDVPGLTVVVFELDEAAWVVEYRVGED